MKFITRYGTTKKVQEVNTEKSRTKQAMRDECDINNILKKYNKTGILPDMIKTNPQYGDFSQAPDYQEALNTVLHAQEQFAGLPARVRESFGNSPENFLKFVHDPQNEGKLIEMGLAKKREAPPAPPKEPITEPKKD